MGTVALKATEIELLFHWDARVGTCHDFYAGEGEEESYFDILHREWVIAVLSLYLLADDIGDEFKLGGGASVPAARDG